MQQQDIINVIKPSWTDTGTSVVAAQVLARGSRARGTIDLTSKKGGYLYVRIGRGGTTALSAGIDVLIRRTVSAGTIIHPGASIPLLGQSAAAVAPTVSGSDVAAGDTEVHLSAITSLAVGDFVCIQDSGGGVTRLEWGRIAKLSVASGTGVTLDSPVQYAHTTGQADTVTNKADCFAPVWLEGGCVWEVIFDYSAQSTGESITIQALAQVQG